MSAVHTSKLRGPGLCLPQRIAHPLERLPDVAWAPRWHPPNRRHRTVGDKLWQNHAMSICAPLANLSMTAWAGMGVHIAKTTTIKG